MPQPDTPRRGLPRWLKALLKLAFAGALIAVMVHFDLLDLDVLKEVRFKPRSIALAAGLMLAGLVLTIARWRLLLGVQDIRPGPWSTIQLGFIGFFFSCVIPGSVSGDAIKAYYVARDSGKTAGAVASVLMDRFLGLYTLAIVSSTAILVLWWRGALDVAQANTAVRAGCMFVVGCVAAMTLFGAALLSRRARDSRILAWLLDHMPFRSAVRKMHDAVLLYSDRRGAAALILGVSFAAQVPMVLGTYVLGRALGDATLRMSQYFMLTPLGLVLNGIPLLPAGLGVGELSFAMLYKAFGSSVGAEIAALWHILFFGFSMIGMLLYVRGRRNYSAISGKAPTFGEDNAADLP